MPHNDSLSIGECYDWVWRQHADLPCKALMLAMADNGGWAANLRDLCNELNIFVPSIKLHVQRLMMMGLVHKRIGGGYVLDIAVDDRQVAA